MYTMENKEIADRKKILEGDQHKNNRKIIRA
jgi:hypothetical protein